MTSDRPTRIYWDHAATTPVEPQVKDAMLPLLTEQFGNPSSLHAWGREAKKSLEQARERVAHCVGAKSAAEIFFSSGATEADNWVIEGVCQARQTHGKHLIISALEHPAVLVPAERLQQQGWDLTILPVNPEGFVSSADVAAALRPDTALVSIIHGHNEIGTIQDIETIGRLLQVHGIPFHTDAVQTMGKIPMALSQLPVDYVSISAHKLYGPKGVGALYVREGAVMPEALIVGGGQEGNLRSGTENLAGIVGLAKALEMAMARLPEDGERLRGLQAELIRRMEAAIPQAVLNGPRDVSLRVPGNVHFSFPPLEGEALVLHLDLKGIAVSSGSACHSAMIEPSKAVKALGKSDEIAKATVRFSMGRTTKGTDLERVVETLKDIVERLGKTGKSQAVS